MCTPLYIWRVTRDPATKPAYKQVVIATLSFVVWAMATDALFRALGFYNPLISALLLPAFTFLVGFL